MQTLHIDVGAARVSASLHGEGATVVALGHGAGGNRTAALLVRFAQALAASGRRVLLHNFPYSESGRRLPDPPALLEATSAAVAVFARQRLQARAVVLGGKSMGGRIASQAVAAGAPADGLLFLGYPLHPPGQTQRLRDAHLGALRVPLLFVQGTRDAFARSDLLQAVLARLGERATLHSVADGDHSFAVRKRSGRSPAQVEGEIVAAAATWLDAHGL